MSLKAKRYDGYVRNNTVLLDVTSAHDLDNDGADIICPDGRTFCTALEAAEGLAHHWTSAGYVAEWLRGEKNWDADQFSTCNAALWDEGVDYGWAIWPCTGGCISWQSGRLLATQEKGPSLEKEGIRGYVEEFWVREHDDALIEKLRDESGIVYSPVSDDPLSSDIQPFGIPVRGFADDDRDGCGWYWPAREALRTIQGAWVHYHHRAPKKYDLIDQIDQQTNRGSLLDIISDIKKINLKLWLRYAKLLPEGATNHDRRALLKASGCWSSSSMDQLSKYGENWNDIWETFGCIPEERFPLLKKSRSTEFIRALRKIPADVDLGKLSVAEIVTLSARYLYENVKDMAVAAAAQAAGLDQQGFEAYQEYWMDRKIKDCESIPYAGVVEVEGYRMYRLESDDPRGPLLGIFTNCCQHPNGAGATCAKHGMESPDGAFFVVEKMGKIIAQSWAWRNGKVVCFDNIEALSGDYLPIVAKLYQQTADRLVGKLGITQVNVGGGYDDLGVHKYWTHTTPRFSPTDCYSDAKSQYCIARKEEEAC